MKNKKIILALVFIAFSLQVFPQIKKANRHYDLFRYSTAIPFYKKAAKSEDEKISKEATTKLADCYRLINDMDNSRIWYLKAIEFKGTDPINYFYLGQALRCLMQYDQAKTAFEKYVQLVPSDQRGPLYLNFCEIITNWKDLPPSAEIKNITTLNSKNSDFGPAFYKKGIVLTSDRQSNLLDSRPCYWTNFSHLDLYYSEPEHYRDFWNEMTAPSSLSQEFNQTYHDGPAFFTDDSKIFLTRAKREKIKQANKNIRTDVIKIYSADLKDKRIAFQEFPFNSNGYSTGHPTLSSDQKTIIFVSDMPGGMGGSDLYMSVMTGKTWSIPENLGKVVNSPGDEVFPSLVNDTLLYFASEGHPGYGGLDLFASRKVNGIWETPENLKAPLNSSYDDFSMIITRDLTSGFFSSNRPGGQGSDDIYAFRKAIQPEKKQVIDQLLLPASSSIVGYVKDKTSKMPLADTRVFVLNTKTNKVKVLNTDMNGYFSMPVETGVLYAARAVKPDYLTDCLNFRIEFNDTSTVKNTPSDLLLDKLEVDKVFQLENIYYDLDKWAIREDAKPALDNLVSMLKQFPVRIELSSHTDCRASARYNNTLSQKRAEAAVAYITYRGIDPLRIVPKGSGETNPVNNCIDGVNCSEAEHQANRRTEFKILSIDKPLNVNQFDPTVFKEGEELDIFVFDPEFFDNCFGSSQE